MLLFVVYIVLLALCLRYHRGKFISREGKYFLSFPHFVNTLFSATIGWVVCYGLYLIPCFHPAFKKRFYDTSKSHEKSLLYSPEELQSDSKNSNEDSEEILLPNQDRLQLASPQRLETMKKEMIEAYGGRKLGTEKTYKEEQLMQLFDILPEIQSETMIGKQFKGFTARISPLPTLSLTFPPNSLPGFGWGKIFHSKHFVDPIVFNLQEKYFVSAPVGGNASLCDGMFRSSLTACMTYDAIAVKDYFKILRPGGLHNEPMLLLGIFMMKDRCGGFFLLKHVENSFIFNGQENTIKQE